MKKIILSRNVVAGGAFAASYIYIVCTDTSVFSLLNQLRDIINVDSIDSDFNQKEILGYGIYKLCSKAQLNKSQISAITELATKLGYAIITETKSEVAQAPMQYPSETTQIIINRFLPSQR